MYDDLFPCQAANLCLSQISTRRDATTIVFNLFHFQLTGAVRAFIKSHSVMQKVNSFSIKEVWKMTQDVDATSRKGTHLQQIQETSATVDL